MDYQTKACLCFIRKWSQHWKMNKKDKFLQKLSTTDDRYCTYEQQICVSVSCGSEPVGESARAHAALPLPVENGVHQQWGGTQHHSESWWSTGQRALRCRSFRLTPTTSEWCPLWSMITCQLKPGFHLVPSFAVFLSNHALHIFITSAKELMFLLSVCVFVW